MVLQLVLGKDVGNSGHGAEDLPDGHVLGENGGVGNPDSPNDVGRHLEGDPRNAGVCLGPGDHEVVHPVGNDLAPGTDSDGPNGPGRNGLPTDGLDVAGGWKGRHGLNDLDPDGLGSGGPGPDGFPEDGVYWV